MKKYYILFGALAVITLALFGYTLSRASLAKQDTNTSKAVERIAPKINNYIIDNPIPESLTAAGITDVPPTITYQKISEKKFSFCVKYNSAATYDGGFAGAVFSQFYGAPNTDDIYKEPLISVDSYVTFYHKKGVTCQTIEPDLYNYNTNLDPTTK